MIEGRLNWPLSPQAQRLHNGASLGKKVTLQTGPTGDTGVCIYVCFSVRVCVHVRNRKENDRHR